MSLAVAHSLKQACRTLLILGLVGLVLMLWLLITARDARALPFTCTGAVRYLVLMGACSATGMFLGLYLSAAMGVDVFGLNRLMGVPGGRPFEGLAAGETERLRLRWVHGGLGFSAGFAFKLLLTDRRLLIGSTLSSWYLLEVPLDQVVGVEQPRGILHRTALRLHLAPGSGRSHWDVRLSRTGHREELRQALLELGIGPRSAATSGNAG